MGGQLHCILERADDELGPRGLECNASGIVGREIVVVRKDARRNGSRTRHFELTNEGDRIADRRDHVHSLAVEEARPRDRTSPALVPLRAELLTCLGVDIHH